MAKHRHLYSQEVLEKFVPTVAAEPVELDAGDDTEVKRVAYAKLENSTGPIQPVRTSMHHEVHSESSSIVIEQERKDSATDIRGSVSATETVMNEHTSPISALPFTLLPPFPPRKQNFDPGELEAALEAAFG